MPTEPTTGLEIFGPVNERTEAVYEATVIDASTGSVVTALDSLSMTIFDLVTKTVIRPQSSVLNTNGGTFTSGNLSMLILAANNSIVNQRRDFEDHVMRFDFTYNSGASEGHHAVVIRVRNLGKLA